MQEAKVDGMGNTIIQIVGNGNQVGAGQPSLLLTRYLDDRLPRQPLTEVPQSGWLPFLSAYSAWLPLLGREQELAALQEFLHLSAPIAVRCLIGEGGIGKTRLALELCDWAVQQGEHGTGWEAGFLACRLEGLPAQRTWSWRKPSLVVIDYAAAHTAAIKAWLTELSDLPSTTPPRPPLRILLLERHATSDSGWWHEVFSSGGSRRYRKQHLFFPSDPIPIAPLPVPQRAQLLESVWQAIGNKTLAAPNHDHAFAAQLAQTDWAGDPLYLMMAALHSSTHHSTATLALKRTDLATEWAEREQERIGQIANAHQIKPQVILHLAAYVTLAQGLDQEQFFAIVDAELTAIGRKNAGDSRDLFDCLTAALPGKNDSIAPILPDLIGEAFIAATWRGKEGESAVWRCFQQVEGKAIQALIRLIQDFGAEKEEKADCLKWLDAVVERAKGDVLSLELIAQHLPKDTVLLRPANIVVTEALATIYRQLATAHPDAFTHYLASSLNNLGAFYSELGRREEAVNSIAEAIKCLSPYFLEHPPAFANWMAVMRRNYFQLCEEANIEPDQSLIEPILKIFEHMESQND